jgi:cell division cycle 20, cofactor of APC complex
LNYFQRSNANNVGDRFITTREETDVTASLDMMSINPQSSSPGHTARLIAATGVPVNKRILSYHEPPPAASSNKSLSQQRELAKPLLHTRNGSLPSSNGVVKSRKIATEPERILEAPDLVDDFYLNVVSWSCLNMVSVALHDQLYIWNGDVGTVNLLGQAPSGGYISSVDFSNDGVFVGVGLDSGDVQLWDVESARKLRTMSGHRGQVATLSWNQHILTSGCGDGSIWHHDVRVARHKVMELVGHTGEVCGLKWRADGELLASGGNDNVVNIWDGRMDESLTADGTAEMRAKWTKRNHTAAVKAIAWCPWQPSLLATGGGTNDASIHIWNSSTGARLHTLKTPAQVTTIQWSPHRKEFMSTHGYPTNAIMVHAYPSLENVAEIRDAHEARVLFSALGPAGDVVVTGAGDEYLKFWRIWEVEKKKKKEVKSSVGLTNTTSSRVLALR